MPVKIPTPEELRRRGVDEVGDEVLQRCADTLRAEWKGPNDKVVVQVSGEECGGPVVEYVQRGLAPHWEAKFSSSDGVNGKLSITKAYQPSSGGRGGRR